MTCSLPSFLAAATRASIPPRSAAEVASLASLAPAFAAVSPDLAVEPAEPQADRESAAAVSTAARAAARERCVITGGSPEEGEFARGGGQLTLCQVGQPTWLPG